MRKLSRWDIAVLSAGRDEFVHDNSEDSEWAGRRRDGAQTSESSTGGCFDPNKLKNDYSWNLECGGRSDFLRGRRAGLVAYIVVMAPTTLRVT